MSKKLYWVESDSTGTWRRIAGAEGTKEYCRGYLAALDSLNPSPLVRVVESDRLDGKTTVIEESGGRGTPTVNTSEVPNMHPVWCQDWEESERGWGIRPDGFTLHLSKVDLVVYVRVFYMAYKNEASAPDEYTRTSGKPRLVDIDDATYLLLQDHASTAPVAWQRYGMWGAGKTGPKAKE